MTISGRDVQALAMLDSRLGANPTVRGWQLTIARRLYRAGLTADAATAAGAIAGVVAGIAFGAGAIGYGLLLLALSAGLDAIDGTIARECAVPSAAGGILDLSADRVVEAAVIIGIAWRRPELYLPALVLVASWYVNITVFLAVGAALERRGPKLVEYPPGILERTEAMIFFVVLAIVPPIGPWLCYLMTALEILTGAQRLLFGLRNASPSAHV